MKRIRDFKEREKRTEIESRDTGKEEEEPNGTVTEAVAVRPAVPSSASTPGNQGKAQPHEAVGAHLAAVPTLRDHNTFPSTNIYRIPSLVLGNYSSQSQGLAGREADKMLPGKQSWEAENPVQYGKDRMLWAIRE